MIANNTYLKDRHQVRLDTVRGVDYTTSPINVALNRATEVSNFIMRDGVPQKRYGYTQNQYFLQHSAENPNGSVLGITRFGALGDEEPIVVTTDGIYVWGRKEIDVANIRQAQFFQNSGALYIITQDSIVGYDSNVSESRKVQPYIPTTTISINEMTEPDPKRASLDAVNRLTNRRKNKMLGVDKSSGKWQVDSKKIYTEAEVSVTIELQGSTINLSNKGSGTQLFDESDVLKGTIEAEGVINLTINTKPIIDGRDNIVVEFQPTEKNADFEFDFATEFGTDGNHNRLFLAGGGRFEYTIYYSEPNQYNYFPDTNTIVLDTPSRMVMLNSYPKLMLGFLKLDDDTLATFVNVDDKANNVYFIKGTQRATYDADGNLIKTQPIFTVQGQRISEVPINNECCITFGNEHLILSENGLFAITLAPLVSIVSRKLISRSYFIDKDFKNSYSLRGSDRYTGNVQPGLSTTRGIVRDTYMNIVGDMLMVNVKDKTYVHLLNHIAPSPITGEAQYEWWVWRGMNAQCWSTDGKYFGKGNRVYELNDKFYDEDNFTNEAGEIGFNGTNFVSSLNINYEKVNTKQDTGARINELLSENTSLNADGKIAISGNFYGYEGEEVGITGTDYYKVGRIVNLTNEGYDIIDDRGIKLNREGCNVFTPLDEGYIVPIEGKVNEFGISRTKGLPKAKIYPISDASQLRFKFYTQHPIVAKMISPIMDMGDNSVSKTLLKMTISTGKAIDSKIKFGYDTRDVARVMMARGTSELNFDDLSFSNFTFETGFQSSYSVLCKVRNFNYIMFKVESDNDKNCAINNMTLLYKINKNNKGVN